MNCEKTITRFLEQEDYTTISLSVRLHLLFCPACRSEVQKAQTSFLLVSEVTAEEMPVNITDSVMLRIEEIEEPYEHVMSNLKWIAVGVILFVGILCTPFNNHLTWLNVYFGRNLEMAIALVLGSAMSIYAAIFAGSHLNYVNKDRIASFINRFINVQ